MKSTTGSQETLPISGATQPPGRWVFIKLCSRILVFGAKSGFYIRFPLLFGIRMPSGTTWASTNVLCGWKTWKEPCGRWMRSSSTGDDPRKEAVQGRCPSEVRRTLWPLICTHGVHRRQRLAQGLLWRKYPTVVGRRSCDSSHLITMTQTLCVCVCVCRHMLLIKVMLDSTINVECVQWHFKILKVLWKSIVCLRYQCCIQKDIRLGERHPLLLQMYVVTV